MVSVCGLRATTQVMSEVVGRPFSSTVATTQVCPPSRNCTSGGGISVGAVMALRARLDARRGEPRAEDGASLIALGAFQLAGDEREQRGGSPRIGPLSQGARSGERGPRGADVVSRCVGPCPERGRQHRRGGRSGGKRPGEVQ